MAAHDPFAVVKSDPGNFKAWEQLLSNSTLDTANKLQAFTSFLDKFPLCYGYWVKYANLALETNGFDKAVEVYESSLVAIPVGVELWKSYIKLITDQANAATDDAKKAELKDLVSKTYERAIDSAGLDYQADSLYTAYIQWATELGDKATVFDLYNRAIQTPMKNVASFLTQAEALMASSEPETYASPEEISHATAQAGAVSPAEIKEKIKEHVLSKWKKSLEQTTAAITSRQPYEDAIRRPWFHPDPIDDISLQQWRTYLTYEELMAAEAGEKGVSKRVSTLFERCLTACALYEEFWLRYATYLEDKDVEQASIVLERGSKVQVHAAPSYSYAWAAFEESKGNIDKARSLLEALQEEDVVTLESIMKYASFEKRQGNIEKGKAAFDKATTAHAEKPASRPYVCASYSHFLRTLGDAEASRTMLKSGIVNDPNCRTLYMQLLDLEVTFFEMENQSAASEARVEEVFKLAAASILQAKEKAMFRKRRVQFLEDYSSNLVALRSAQINLAEGLTRGIDKKRKPEGPVVSEQPAKRPYVQHQAPQQQQTTWSQQQPAQAAWQASAAQPAQAAWQAPAAQPAQAATTAAWGQHQVAAWGQHQQAAVQAAAWGQHQQAATAATTWGQHAAAAAYPTQQVAYPAQQKY